MIFFGGKGGLKGANRDHIMDERSLGCAKRRNKVVDIAASDLSSRLKIKNSQLHSGGSSKLWYDLPVIFRILTRLSCFNVRTKLL